MQDKLENPPRHTQSKQGGVCAWPFSHVQLSVAHRLAHQAPLSTGFPRQEYWSGLLFPTPGDLPNPGNLGRSLCLLHWQVGPLPLAPPGKPRQGGDSPGWT